MELKKITFENFRQFYGIQELTISTDPKKNVTLIHAENGVGKTTILNAILWCFYEETTARFEKPEKIVSNQAVSEHNYLVKVEVLFTQDGKDYLVIREKNEHSRESRFQAFVINGGNFTELDNPTVFVNSVIPQEMAKYFFFDGEYAETFSSQKNKSKVREALEDMLGCRTANIAIKDLDKIKKSLEKKISALTKNNSAQQFQRLIDENEGKLGSNLNKLNNLQESLEAAEQIKKELRKQLRGAEATREIQERKEEYEKTLKRYQASKVKKEAELTMWINSEGIGLLTYRLNKNVNSVIEAAKVEGKVPSKVAADFVKGILQRQKCICNREFKNPSAESRAIEELLQDAGTAKVNDRVIDSRVLLGKLSDKQENANSTYLHIKEEIASIVNEISQCESKIDECVAKLKGCEVKEMVEKQEALDRKEDEIKQLEKDIYYIKFKNQELKEKIESNKEKRDKQLKSNNKAVVLQQQIAIIDQTKKVIEKELEKYREESRVKITSDVNDILASTARRDYCATIDKDFNVEMRYFHSSTPVARSTGENQLLSFAFIGALLKFTSERMQSESEILKPGTSAPLVLDSPFGLLDPAYQKATATFLPNMAKQVVLLLSKTQANTDVMESLKERVGKEYVLISENTSPQGDKPSDIININGESISSSLYECEKDRTLIKPV